jgi:hypothetical protein
MPYKDPVKQKEYQRNYQKDRRQKQKLLNLQLRYKKIAVKLAHENIVGRIVLKPEITKEYVDGASIVPIIHANFVVGDEEALKKAVLRVVSEENKLFLSGEHTGWEAGGIMGLSTTEGRLVASSNKPLTTESLSTVLSLAVTKLLVNRHDPPFTLILNEKHKNITVPSQFSITVLYSPDLYRKDGSDCDGLLLVDSDKNRYLLLKDLDVFIHKNRGEVFEALCPVIEDPTAICELQFKTEQKETS